MTSINFQQRFGFLTTFYKKEKTKLNLTTTKNFSQNKKKSPLFRQSQRYSCSFREKIIFFDLEKRRKHENQSFEFSFESMNMVKREKKKKNVISTLK